MRLELPGAQQPVGVINLFDAVKGGCARGGGDAKLGMIVPDFQQWREFAGGSAVASSCAVHATW
jgi:hypothetical protein